MTDENPKTEGEDGEDRPAMARRIDPKLLQPQDAHKVAEHITEFSLAGLHAMRGRRRRNKRRPGKSQRAHASR